MNNINFLYRNRLRDHLLLGCFDFLTDTEGQKAWSSVSKVSKSKCCFLQRGGAYLVNAREALTFLPVILGCCLFIDYTAQSMVSGSLTGLVLIIYWLILEERGTGFSGRYGTASIFNYHVKKELASSRDIVRLVIKLLPDGILCMINSTDSYLAVNFLRRYTVQCLSEHFA